MAELTVGDIAPDFRLPSHDPDEICLRDFLGKPLVLYFYPKDDTPGCTKQAIGFTCLAQEFEALGAAVIGISPDSAKRHEKFAAKHGLKHLLGADEDTAIANLYGVWQEKSLYGRKFMGIARTTFLIGCDGRILKIWPKVKVEGHAREVLEALKAV